MLLAFVEQFGNPTFVRRLIRILRSGVCGVYMDGHPDARCSGGGSDKPTTIESHKGILRKGAIRALHESMAV